MEAHLLERWCRDCVGSGATAAQPDVEAAGMDLLRRWSSEHRRYHDVRHLTAVLDAVEELAADGPGPGAGAAPDLRVVRLAAWFHDAVYDGQPGRDERASAALADQVLTALGVAADYARRVGELVLVTAGHDPDDVDADARLLCDADLSVLGSTPQRYREYAVDVRVEYAHVPDAAFRAGRSRVLRTLLERPQLFCTDAARRRWEQPARANITAELERLGSSNPSP